MSYKDPAKAKSYLAEYYKQNKPRLNAANAAYRIAHKEQLAAANALWVAANPEIIRKNKRTLKARFTMLCRGARVRELPVNLNAETYAALVTGAVCHYCEGALPETGGGLDRKNSSLGYSTKNCVPCCRACNSIRGKDLISYSEMLVVAKVLRELRSKQCA